MKKFKIFLLFILLIGVCTCFSIAGFYVNENSSAVVNWWNNEKVVSNEDYKLLVEETSSTVTQLNIEIARLEDSNATLTIEKINLEKEISNLEGDLESNQELINDYLSQIDYINSQLELNNQRLNDLNELIDNLYEDLIIANIGLPDEFKNNNKSVVFEFYGNDFFIHDNSSLTYYYDFDRGELSFVTDKCIPYQSFKIPTGYLFKSSSGSDCYFYNKTSKECFVVASSISGSLEFYDKDGLGCYICTSGEIYYFDYLTSVCDLILSPSYGKVPIKPNLFDIGSKLYVAANRGFAQIDKETNTAVELFKTTHSTFSRVFEINNELFILGTDQDSSWLKKFDFENNTPVLVAEITHNNRNFNEVYIYNDVCVFTLGNNVYSFNGLDLVLLSESHYISDLNKVAEKTVILYENEDVRYFTSTNTKCFYKFDKQAKLVSIIDMGYRYGNHYSFNDNVILISCFGTTYFFDISLESLTLSSITTYNVALDMYIEIGDYVYLSSSVKVNYSYNIYKINKETLAVNICSVKTLNNIDNAEVLGSYILFYGDNHFFLYNSTLTTDYTGSFISYDSSKSIPSERVFYQSVSSIEKGQLYYKYEIFEDGTYERSLVLFNN